VGDPTGPGGTPADYAINALAVWVQLQGEAIHSDEADDEPSPPRRVYGELETGPFHGPMGRVEPGDRLRLYVAPPDDDSPLRGDMTGRFLGTQLIDGRKHVVLEIVATDQGSYRTVIPVEDAGRLTKIAPPEGGEA